jgi:hypothetical protein
MKPPKYRNKRVVVDGVRFDSAGESRRWAELQLLERAGQIRNLERQKRIPLLSHSGVKVAECRIDFAYFEGEKRIWEDFKSAVTRKLPTWRRNIRHIRADYPNVELREYVKGK